LVPLHIPLKRNDELVAVAIAFLGFIAIGLAAGILGVAWPSIRDTFALSLDAIGALLLPATASALVINFSSGSLIRRAGLGPVLIVGFAVSALANLGVAVAPAWWMVVAVSLVGAMGTSAVVVGLNTFFAISQSARLMNWLQACFGLGATLSPILMASLLNAGYSWRWCYVSFFACFTALAGAVGLTLSQWKFMAPRSGRSGGEEPDQAPSGATLRIPFVWLYILLFFVLTGTEGTAGQWPYTLFTEARSIDPGTAGLWVSIFWLSLTVGRVIFGFVVDRVTAIVLVRGAMTGVIVGSALIWLNFSAMASFLGFTLVGFSTAPLFPVLTSGTPNRLGKLHATNSIGFQLASSRLGLAVVPAIGGVLAESMGLEIIAPFLFFSAIVQFAVHELTLLKTIQPKQD
jgi:fucose permease